MDRRDFVKLFGGSLFGLAIGGGAGTILKLPKKAEPILYSGPRIESWKLTACTKCPGSCSLKIRLIDNLPIQAFGNTYSPINEGGICPQGLVSVADLYHPDRLTGPVKKINGEFKPISYEEAYKILVNNLRKIASAKRQNDVFIVAQTESALRAELFKKFSYATGFENLIVDNFQSGSSFPFLKIANKAPDFIDFDKCDYLLNFGAQLTEISQNPLYFTRRINEFRAKGFKITAVQPRLTNSVAKVDKWIPLQPVSFGNFALGIAYVLLKDEQYDKNFLEKNFSGFSDFKDFVIENFVPDNVEKLTGIPAEKILQIGREFEKASAPAAYFDESVLYNSNGTQNAFAIIALNALKGFRSFGKIKSFLSSVVQNDSQENQTTFSNLMNRLSKNKVKALLISGSNFLFNNPNSEALKKQLSSIPFIVSFSSFVDETSSFAKLIIPDHSNMEKLDLLLNTSMGVPAATLQQPIVDPFYKTADTGDVIISLIKDIKPGIKIPYENYSDFVTEAAKKIYSGKEGIFMDQSKPTVIEKGLRQLGWQTEQFGSFDDFWDSLTDSGGWWNPFADKESYNPKINFKSENYKEFFGANNSLSSLPKNKLRLNIFKRNLDYKGNMSIYPVLIEQFGSSRSVFYQLWTEINPETARSLSLSNRSKIILKTNKGNFPVILIYNPSVTPGNLDIPFGLGHTLLGDKSGTNPLNFSENKFDKITGKPSFTETLVEIEGTRNSSLTAKLKSNQKLSAENQIRSDYA